MAASILQSAACKYVCLQDIEKSETFTGDRLLLWPQAVRGTLCAHKSKAKGTKDILQVSNLCGLP